MMNYLLGIRKQSGGGQLAGLLGQCSASLGKVELKLVHIIVIRCSDARLGFHYAFNGQVGYLIVSG